MKRKFVSVIVSVVLVLSLLMAAIPSAVFADGAKELSLAVISDLHYYPEELTGNYCENFVNFSNTSTKEFVQVDALVQSALAAIEKHAKTSGLKYVLIPGDLSKDSEYAAHAKLAQILEQFEARTGIQVFVTPGNHDINNSNASSFETGEKTSARKTTPEDFREIYKNLGYDNACNVYTPSSGKGGGLTYSAILGDYRLISIDTCKYSADYTDDGIDEHETAGKINPELMQWVLNEIADAKANGQTVLGMGHHSLAPHFGCEPTILQGFMLDDWLEVSEAFADAGMHYWFSGHIHVGSIASGVSDNGETLYDICTASLMGYPNTFREIKFTTEGEKISADIETFEVDCEKQIVANSVTYDIPYSTSFSFGQTFGHNGLTQFGEDMAMNYVNSLFKAIKDEGGLSKFLIDKDINLEDIIDNVLNGGLTVGSIDIFTAKNVMGLVNYLLEQVDRVYINDVDHTQQIINNSLDKLMSLKVSDIPCTRFIDTYGFGDASRAGTLADLGSSVLAYNYSRRYDAHDDAFVMDALDGFKNGDTVDRLFNLLIEILLDDLIQNEILSQLELRFSPLFTNEITRKTIGSLIDCIFKLIIGGNNTFKGIVDFVFGLGLLPYDSLNDVVNHLKNEYWTTSQNEGLGYTIEEIISGFVFDDDPNSSNDLNPTLVYNGKVSVEATSDDYRLPSNLVQTFGNDTSSSVNIGWYTKYSVTGTDIEILPYSENPAFTGTPTTGAGIEAVTEQVDREFPGVDIGIIGFFPYVLHLNRHTVKLTGLSAGTKYSYRVGDASRNWWSEAGVIETADGSDSTAFIHITDPQSQNIQQYTNAWSNTIKKAFSLFPESKFIVSTGDNVDYGTNVNQWKWYMNSASDILLDKPMATATGNHEDNGGVIPINFPLANIPEQDTETGVYYSYDYNNIHFIILNTNDLGDDDALSAKQLEWLKNDAESNDADWTVLMLHKALYSNSSHYDDDDVVALRNQLGELLPDLGVDVVLQGHDHVYLRTGVLDSNKLINTETRSLSYDGRSYTAKVEPQGTVYSIAGTSGVKFYPTKTNKQTDKLFPRAEKLVDVDTPVFTAYHVEGDVLYYDAYTVDGDKVERIDSFAIIKDEASVNYNNVSTPFALSGSSVDAKTDTSEETTSLSLATSIETVSSVDTTASSPATSYNSNVAGASSSNENDDNASAEEVSGETDTENPRTGSTDSSLFVFALLGTVAVCLVSKKKKKDD